MDVEIRARLVGQELDSVCFVRDYVELRIDDCVVRALTNPTGVIGGKAWTFPDDGSADLLRRYIDLVVEDVVHDEELLELRFSSGDRIVVSLRAEDRLGPEALHFVPADAGGRPDVGRMLIW